MKDGELASIGSWGFARMPADTPDHQGIPFDIDTRCNLASVSKTVTATALFVMVAKDWVASVNEPFWPILAAALPGVTPASGVASVTLGELLMMLARLPEDGALSTLFTLHDSGANALAAQDAALAHDASTGTAAVTHKRGSLPKKPRTPTNTNLLGGSMASATAARDPLNPDDIPEAL